MKRKMALFIAGLLAMFGIGVIAPQAASAGASICGSGFTQVYSKYTPSSLGQLVLYYSPANGGTNCVVFYHTGATYGQITFTDAQIRLTGGTWHVDYGAYAYYAGPVKITGTNGHCVDIYGYLVWHGSDYIASANGIACG